MSQTHRAVRPDPNLAELSRIIIPLQTAVKTLNESFKGLASESDPVLRHSILLDRLYIFFDLLITAVDIGTEEQLDRLNSFLNDPEIAPEIRQQYQQNLTSFSKSLAEIKEFSNNIKHEMKILAELIGLPIYSPEHPAGKNYISNRATTRETMLGSKPATDGIQ